MKRPELFFCLVVILAGLLVYFNALDNEFVWDDSLWVTNNACLKDGSSVKDIFTTDLLSKPGRKFDYYRPVQMLSLMLDYRLYGLNAFGYHLTNLIIHILAGLSLFYLLNLLFKDSLLSFIASLLFVVHPLQTSAVSYISGRADPLCALFLITSFIMFIFYRGSKKLKFYIFSLILFIMAILSREIALIFPAFLFLYDWRQLNSSGRDKVVACLPFAAFGGVYYFLRRLVMGVTAAAPHKFSLLVRIPGGLKSISEYLRLFILPRGLHLDYGFPRISIFSGGAILGLLAVLFLLYYIFRAGRKRKEVFFGILWFFVFFIPVSGIYPLNVYMAEHWMYLPSAGVFTILAWLLTRLTRRGGFFTPAGWGLLIAVLGFFSCVSISQNKNYWSDNLTLYRRTLELAPRSFRARGNLAGIYLEKGLVGRAESEYKKAIELKPDFASAYEGLGLVYFKKGDYSEAVKYLKKSVRLKPDCLSAYNNLGNAYFRSYMYNEAEKFYNKALEIDAGYVKAINNLALIYYDRGWKEKAKKLWLDALRIDPDYKAALNNLKIFFGNGSFKGD